MPARTAPEPSGSNDLWALIPDDDASHDEATRRAHEADARFVRLHRPRPTDPALDDALDDDLLAAAGSRPTVPGPPPPPDPAIGPEVEQVVDAVLQHVDRRLAQLGVLLSGRIDSLSDDLVTTQRPSVTAVALADHLATRLEAIEQAIVELRTTTPPRRPTAVASLDDYRPIGGEPH